MNKKRLDWLYIGLAVICFGVSGWLIGQIFLGDKEVSVPNISESTNQIMLTPWKDQEDASKNSLTLELNAEKLEEMLGKLLPYDFMFSNISMSFPKENQIAINAMIKKEVLKDYLKKKGLLTLSTRTALLALPKNSEIFVLIQIEKDKEKGSILFTPVSVKIDRWTVPQSMLQSTFLEEISLSIEEILKEIDVFKN